MTSLRHIAAVVAAAILGIAPVHAQWTNPTSGAAYVTVMSDTNGVLKGPKSLDMERATVDEIVLGAASPIDAWSDLAGPLGLSSYLTGIGQATAPAAPYGSVLNSGSAPTPVLRYVKGQGGITVTNDGSVLYIDGSATNSVDALFPVQTSNVVRIYYRSSVAPYSMGYADLPNTTNGYLQSDGTNVRAVAVIVGTASNADLLASQPGPYYRDFDNLTNVLVFDDGVLQGSDLMGYEAGDNVDVAWVTRTNNGRTGVVFRINVANVNPTNGTADIRGTSNRWTEANVFEDDVQVEGRVIISDNGNSMTGAFATVGGGGTNNVASGSYAIAAGGRQNTASGTDAAVGGGRQNTASDTAGTVAGGAGNSAGQYASVGGGDDNDVSGAWSAAPGGRDVDVSGTASMGFGEYLSVTSNRVVLIGWGMSTNKFGPRIATNGVDVRGAVMADAFLNPDGSPYAVTTIQGIGFTTTPRTVFFGGFTATVSGTTATLYPTNAGGGSGSLTGAVVGAESSSRLTTTNNGSANVTINLDVTGLATNDQWDADIATSQTIATNAAAAAQSTANFALAGNSSANATSTQGRVWSTNAPPTVGSIPYWTGSQIDWSAAPPSSSTGSVSSVNNTNGNITIVGGPGVSVTTTGTTINVASAGGGATGMVYIGSYTATGGEASVTFAGIPQTYNTLRAWGTAFRLANSSDLYNELSLRINGNTNYVYAYAFANRLFSAGDNTINFALGTNNASYCCAVSQAGVAWDMQLPDYTVTNRARISLWQYWTYRSSSLAGNFWQGASWYFGNDAITSLTYTIMSTNTLASGSTFYLYGVTQ